MEQSHVKSDTDQESAILRAWHEKYPDQKSFDELSPQQKFEICKLAIKSMATALQGVNLRKLGKSDADPFGVYEDDLFKILGHLQSLHESPIGNQLKMDEFRPSIDDAVEQLSSALMYKDEKEFHNYMHHLIAFSHAISVAKEKLEAITIDDAHEGQ